jgi:hypothetical protein
MQMDGIVEQATRGGKRRPRGADAWRSLSGENPKGGTLVTV